MAKVPLSPSEKKRASRARRALKVCQQNGHLKPLNKTRAFEHRYLPPQGRLKLPPTAASADKKRKRKACERLLYPELAQHFSQASPRHKHNGPPLRKQAGLSSTPLDTS